MNFEKLVSVAAMGLMLSACRSASNAPVIFDPSSLGPSGATLKKYLDRQDEPKANPAGQQAQVSEVKIEASIPNLNKKGEMLAQKTLLPDGRIQFEMKSFTGDNTIKKEVIGRYLSSEQETSEGGNIGIHPQNYRFKFRRKDSLDNHPASVFELNPRKSVVGLFKGELWLDDDTGLPLREIGRLVKNPSVIFKTLDFTRDYAVKAGKAYLSKVKSEADTRVIGKVLMTMEFEAPHNSSNAASPAARRQLSSNAGHAK